LECDKNSAIASVSSSWFRWYIYFHKLSPYGGDIPICPPSQTCKNLGCWLYLSVQSVRPHGGPYHHDDMEVWWCGTYRLVVCRWMLCWHVSLCDWFICFVYVKWYGGCGVQPPDLPKHQSFHNTLLDNIPAHVPCYITQRICIYVWISCYVEKGAGRGLRPDPWFRCNTYNRMFIYGAGLNIVHGLYYMYNHCIKIAGL